MHKVMVVDDDEAYALLVCKMLEKKYTTLPVTNGQKALRIAESARPDVIILDVIMPEDTDGFTIFNELQRQPATRNTPVIMLTNVNRMTGLDFTPESMRQYMGSGPSAFLDKPVSARKLLNTVAKALARPTPASHKATAPVRP